MFNMKAPLGFLLFGEDTQIGSQMIQVLASSATAPPDRAHEHHSPGRCCSPASLCWVLPGLESLL